MTGANASLWISFILALLGLTGVLIWGLKLISSVLRERSGGGGKDGQNGPSVLRAAMSEKAVTNAQPGQEPSSFSRIAGAIGAVAIAATFVGLGYWIIYGLFFNAKLERLEDLGIYFLSGSALFMPYAFNKLSTIFK